MEEIISCIKLKTIDIKSKFKINNFTTIKNRAMDKLFKILFWACAAVLCIVLLAIILFIGKTGILVFNHVSPLTFFLSTEWFPEEEFFGAAIFILGTLSLTALTLIISVPLSLILSAFIAEIAPNYLKKIFRSFLNLLVGIPSVIYGYLGITVLIPIIRTVFHQTMGDGIFASAIVLSFMVLPTIVRISEDAITFLPKEYKEAAYALGSNRSQVIWRVLIPAAKNGILAAIILGMARAIGETMAVVMVIGNVAQLPVTLFTPTSVLTSNIVMQITNVQFDSTWNYALYMMAFMLLVISLILILVVRVIRSRSEKRA